MNTYSTADLKELSIEEITNLVNQIYDEKDLYKKKYESLLAAKKKHIVSSQVADKAQNLNHQWVKECMHAHNPVKSISNKYKIRSYDANDDPYDNSDPNSNPFDDLYNLLL